MSSHHHKGHRVDGQERKTSWKIRALQKAMTTQSTGQQNERPQKHMRSLSRFFMWTLTLNMFLHLPQTKGDSDTVYINRKKITNKISSDIKWRSNRDVCTTSPEKNAPVMSRLNKDLKRCSDSPKIAKSAIKSNFSFNYSTTNSSSKFKLFNVYTVWHPGLFWLLNMNENSIKSELSASNKMHLNLHLDVLLFI